MGRRLGQRGEKNGVESGWEEVGAEREEERGGVVVGDWQMAEEVENGQKERPGTSKREK